MNKKDSLPELVHQWGIIGSDDDQPLYEDLSVGLTSDGRLIVIDEHTDYDTPLSSGAVWAEVSADQTYRLARRLGVPLGELPRFIARSMDDRDGEINPSCGYVTACFKEVVERLNDEGCRVRIFRNRP